MFAVFVVGLFVISACEQAVGRRLDGTTDSARVKNVNNAQILKGIESSAMLIGPSIKKYGTKTEPLLKQVIIMGVGVEF